MHESLVLISKPNEYWLPIESCKYAHLVWICFMLYSHICTCRAISMQCVVQEAVVAVFWTQRTQMAARAILMIRRLEKGSSFSSLDPRTLKCCSLIAGIQIQQENYSATGQILLARRWLASAIGAETLIRSRSIIFITSFNPSPIRWMLVVGLSFPASGLQQLSLQGMAAATSKFDDFGKTDGVSL